MPPDADFDLGSSMEETYREIQGGGDAPPDDSGDAPSATPADPLPAESPAASAAPSTSTPPEGLTPAQAEAWKAMPKSWRKEMEQHWTGLPPNVMQYVHEREKQALDGIMQYKGVADQWNETMTPFQKWFDHYKIDPRDAFKRLATSHIVLKYGKPEDRARWAQQLVNDYGLADVLGIGQQANGQAAASPAHQPQQVPEQYFQLEQRLNAVQEDLYQRQLKENQAVVERFFNDPANEYAAELQEDILRLFEKGSASTLQEAYEQARWLNPAVRDKIMKREIENATKPPARGPLNVRSSSVAPAPTEAGEESLEETMRATLHRIRSR